MELSDLKKDWQHAGAASKNEEELKRMTKIMHHPAVRRIKTKLFIELVWMTMLLFVYYDWFDGDKKPAYANIFFVIGIVLYIVNNIWGYVSMISRPENILDIKSSLESFLIKVKRLSVMSVGISVLYSASFILFFTSTITFVQLKYNLLIALIIMLLIMFYLSYRLWLRWIKQLTIQLRGFDGE